MRVRSRATQRGFTLIELVLSMGMLVLICGVVAGVVSLAGRSMESPDERATGPLETARVLSGVLDELSLATSVTTAQSGKVEFTTGDVTGDGAADSVSYSWSEPGAPLLRTVNAGAEIEIAPAVAEFGVAFTSREATHEVAGADAEGAEQLLASWSLDGPVSAKVTATSIHAQYLRPALSAEVTGWRPTRIELFLASEGPATGSFQVRAFAASPPSRGLTALCSTSVSESSLPATAGWHSVSLPVPGVLGPTQGLLVTIGQGALGDSGTLRARLSGVPARGGALAIAALSGLAWTDYPDGSLRFRLYGRTTSPSTLSLGSPRLAEAAVRLRMGAEAMVGSTRMLAEPDAPLEPAVVEEGLVGSVIDALGQLLGLGGGGNG
ncbi:MAG: PulJ/GspJ family protein [Phycisphaerales bacterium]